MRSDPYPSPSMSSYHEASGTRSSGPQVATNALAIASLVLGVAWLYWIGSILAVVTGHVALHQIRQSHGRQQGGGMAMAGVVLGWVGVAVLGLVVLV